MQLVLTFSKNYLTLPKLCFCLHFIVVNIWNLTHSYISLPFFKKNNKFHPLILLTNSWKKHLSLNENPTQLFNHTSNHLPPVFLLRVSPQPPLVPLQLYSRTRGSEVTTDRDPLLWIPQPGRLSNDPPPRLQYCRKWSAGCQVSCICARFLAKCGIFWNSFWSKATRNKPGDFISSFSSPSPAPSGSGLRFWCMRTGTSPGSSCSRAFSASCII